MHWPCSCAVVCIYVNICKVLINRNSSFWHSPCWCSYHMLEALARLKQCVIRTLKLKCICLQLDSIILKLFCNLNDSMVLWISVNIPQTGKGFEAAFPAQSHSFISLPTHAILHVAEGMHSTSCLWPSCCGCSESSLLLIHNHRPTTYPSPHYASGQTFSLSFRECWHI